MSHFGINPIMAKGYFKTSFDLMEKMYHDAMLHDAFFYGLFPPEQTSDEYLGVFEEMQSICRKYPVSFIQPKKMPDVGTIGHPDEPCLNELTRLIRDGFNSDELSIVVGRPNVSTAIRPEILEIYKNRRNKPVVHIALEETRDCLYDRFSEIMGNTIQTTRRF